MKPPQQAKGASAPRRAGVPCTAVRLMQPTQLVTGFYLYQWALVIANLHALLCMLGY
jgi:hypothetical protein